MESGAFKCVGIHAKLAVGSRCPGKDPFPKITNEEAKGS
jgi:hypothetical protein